MINPTYPGVYVLEESSGARAIAGVATSITAFVGTTQRGPLLTPSRIFSPREYDRIFGPSSAAGEMAEQVRLFFDNGGGEAWITRVAQNSEPSTILLRDEDGNDTLELTALEDGIDGNNLRVEVTYATGSPESTFNLRLYRRIVQTDGTADEQDIETFSNLSMNPDSNNFVETAVNNVSSLASVEVANAPQLPGYGESFLYSGLILPSNAANAANTVRARLGGPGDYSFQLRYNGGPPDVVTVTIGAASTITQIRNAISTAMSDRLLANGIAQVVTPGFLNPGSLRQITYEMPGASFEILPAASNDLAAPLMLTVASGAVYVDQWALNRPAPTGYVARLHSATNANDIEKLMNFADHPRADISHWEINDASPAGSPGEQVINYSIAAGDMIVGTRFTPTAVGDLSQGALANVQENLQAIADSISADANDRWDAAVHGHRLVLSPTFGNSDADLTAAITTSNGPAAGAGQDLAAADELFDGGEDPNNVAAYVFGRNGTGIGGGPYQDRAGATDGDDGDLPQEDEYRAAFDVMEREVDLFNLMVLPRAVANNGTQTDPARKVAFDLASSFCARERAFLLVDPPSTDPAISWDDANEAATGADALRIGIDTRNSAVFWPRLRMADGTFQDPSGPVAGLMSRIDGSRGVWKAAAGVGATLRGVQGVEHMMSDNENGVINPRAVNALRVFPDGLISWGARTLVGFNDSGNIDDKYIPVRRTMLFIEESLYRGLRFAVFEPNAEPLWAQIRLAAGSFMNGLFRQGAFAGQKASDAYYVLCDATTTTETDRQLGIVNVVVAFAPLRPAEFVILTVKQIAGQVEV